MWLFDWIYPKKCVGCGLNGSYVCEGCRKGVRTFGESLKYEGVVRKLIKEIKYRGSFDMVEELVEMWIDHMQVKCSWQGTDWVVTAVPMYSFKQRSRGYNQAELLARVIAKRAGLEYRELLVRSRATKPMYGLNVTERGENIHNAFAIKPITSCPKKVILVDDVWTTGATMKECAKVLKKAGVATIRLVAIAR